jgi:hypothetical protein
MRALCWSRLTWDSTPRRRRSDPYILATDLGGVGKGLQLRLGAPAIYHSTLTELSLTPLWQRRMIECVHRHSHPQRGGMHFAPSLMDSFREGEKIMAPRHNRLHSGVLSGQPYVFQCSHDTAGDPSPRQSPTQVLTLTSLHVRDPAAEIATKRGYHAIKAAKDDAL